MYKLIVVDDENFVRKDLIGSINWKKHGFEPVAEASCGLEALNLIEKIKPDLVITDIKMPDMNGIELLRRIKSAYPEIQVIILSAYDDFSYAQQAIRFCACGYLLKPVNKAELEEVLIKAVDLAERRAVPANTDVNFSIAETAKLFIIENYTKAISIEDIAKHCCVNKSYLSRKFKDENGITIVDYITHLRIRKACELLRDSQYSVSEISQRVGYEDYTYFCKVFKKEYDLTPLQYRMNQKLGRM